MSDLDVDICCLSETWLRKGDTSKISEIKELGFCVRHVSRPGRGGGVAIAYKKNINVTKVTKKNVYGSFEHIECLAKSTSNKPLRIICLYRSGTGVKSSISDFCEDFNDYLDYLNQCYGKLLIVGDFNIHVENEKNPDTTKFLSILNQHKLQQHIHVPTHICEGTLDLVLTRDIINERLDINELQIIKTNTTSDHYLVKFMCKFPHSKNTFRKEVSGRNVKNVDLDQFKLELLSSDLNDHTKYIDSDNAVELYNTKLYELLNKHAPLKNFIVNENQPSWMDVKCQEAKRTRRKFERLHKKQKTEASQIAYSDACKNAAIVLNTTRDQYYKTKLSLHNQDKKQTYSLVNHLLDKDVASKCLPTSKESSVIAEEMKEFFKSKVENIYSEIDSNETPKIPFQATTADFQGKPWHNFNSISEEELISIISDLNKKECELDPIPVTLLFKCLPELIKILHFIVNYSLSSGKFPSSLKEALVRPAVKDINGDLDDYKNYRPISNLPFLSKVIEKCVHKQLSTHLNLHSLYAEFQSGYRTHHSCETATLAIYNDLLCLSDTKSKVILLLLDLSAAFDTVCHKLLLNKLYCQFGLTGIVLSWFKSYLGERSFTVNVEKSKSGRCILTIGVPQGSILGPILFILYTKDLEIIAKNHGFQIHLYADDTQLYIEFSPLFDKYDDIESRIINCFKEISHWMKCNKLKLNADKTKALIVKSKNNFDLEEECITSLKLSGSESVDCCETVKSLGVYFDRYLTFDYHISNVVQSCNITLRNLWMIGSKLDFELKRQLIHCLVFSKLDYCNGLYYNIPAYQLKRLQKIQNSCARFLFGKHIQKFDRVTPFLEKAHFLPVKERIHFKIALMAFKCLNNINPNYLNDCLTVKGQLNRTLRHENDFFLLNPPPLPRLLRTERGISHASPTVWNQLPYDIRSSNDIVTFKRKLKTHYFNKAFHK